MSSRKAHKSMGRDGERRRSPRISALDASKANDDGQQFTRKTLKRKFDDSANFTPVSKLAKQVWKGRDNPKNADDHSTDYCVEWRSGRESRTIIRGNDGKASIMPAKHILELVLDTLQRRDTYEIFAEPVDPDEVEDYYEIIKEPMDFGTMRAKLHEGMYENLEQFEYDVFLIPENAMHFNSSTTIYFRQGRVLHDLAKKVFHALKTDPENFVSEFSGTRRRSMRKALSVAKDSIGGDVSSKGALTMCPPSTSTIRRGSKKNTDYYSRKTVTRSRDSRLCEVGDRRCTYWESTSSMYDHQGNKTLLLMNGGDVSYKDSLMSYVKDLGATAQMVAKRKLLLLGQHESKKGWVATQKKADPLFRTFRDFAPAACNPFLKASDVIDLTGDHGGEEANDRKRGEKEKSVDGDCGTTAAGGKEKDKEKERAAAAVSLTNRNRVAKKDGVGSTSFRSDDNARPVILALENSHSNVGEYNNKSRNKKSWIMASPRPQPAAERPTAVSQFAFDLPFLKARLNQMKVPSFQKGGAFKVVKPFLYNHQSTPPLESNLALQL